MGHVHKEIGPHGLGDVGKPGEVDGPGVGGSAGDNHFGLLLPGQLLQGVVVNETVPVHPVGDDVVQQAGLVHRGAVGQVSAVVQRHAQHRIAGLAQGLIHRHVGLGPRVGLYVGIGRAEQPAHPADGLLLHQVHVLTAAVVALAGVAFGVFVGEHRAHGRHHRLADDVLGGDQLNVPVLPLKFQTDHVPDNGVHLFDQCQVIFKHRKILSSV